MWEPSCEQFGSPLNLLEIFTMDNKNKKRIAIITGIALVIGAGYWLMPMMFDLFLALHGMG